MKRKRKNKTKVAGNDTVRYYAWSLIKNNPLGFSVIVTIIAVSLTGVLFVSLLAAKIYQVKQENMNSLTKRIVATCSVKEAADKDRNFDKYRIAEIATMPQVKYVWGNIISGVMVGRTTSKFKFYMIETTIPEDPELSARSMYVGRSVSSRSVDEIVLPNRVFMEVYNLNILPSAEKIRKQYLGKKIFLQITRTSDNQEETLVLDYKLVGVAKLMKNSVFLPIDNARRIDLWRSYVIQTPSKKGKSVFLEANKARVLISSEASKIDLEQMQKGLGIKLKKMFDYQIVDKPGPFTLRIYWPKNKKQAGKKFKVFANAEFPHSAEIKNFFRSRKETKQATLADGAYGQTKIKFKYFSSGDPDLDRIVCTDGMSASKKLFEAGDILLREGAALYYNPDQQKEISIIFSGQIFPTKLKVKGYFSNNQSNSSIICLDETKQLVDYCDKYITMYLVAVRGDKYKEYRKKHFLLTNETRLIKDFPSDIKRKIAEMLAKKHEQTNEDIYSEDGYAIRPKKIMLFFGFMSPRTVRKKTFPKIRVRM